MKEIKLKGTNMTSRVDDEDYDALNHLPWRLTNGYAGFEIVSDRKRISIYLHRVISDVTNPKLVVDHIDGDPLNNSKSNLRVCTQQLNSCNRTILNSNNKSGFRGVSYHIGQDKWIASIMVNNKSTYLGIYSTPEEAALYFNYEAKKLFGEYKGLLNFEELSTEEYLALEKKYGVYYTKIKVKASNTSGFRGVEYDKRSNRYSYGLRILGKRYRKSGYATAEEAAKAYDVVSRRERGEDTKFVNFPTSD